MVVLAAQICGILAVAGVMALLDLPKTRTIQDGKRHAAAYIVVLVLFVIMAVVQFIANYIYTLA